MAFTLAHPAAIMPLRKLPFLALLPLAIGSMVPDLIPLLPFGLEWHLPNSHSPIGTVLVDLPAGYLLLLMTFWLRHALVQPLWQPHRAIAMHAINDYFATPRCWLIALPSLLLGSWTHVIWDRFTHETRWTYHHLPVLYQPLFPDATHELPLFHFLQYATSLLGLLLLAWYYWLAVKQQHGTAVDLLPLRSRRLQMLAVLVVAALALGALRLWQVGSPFESIYARLSMILKTALGCFGVMYVLTGLLMRSKARLALRNQP